MAEEYWDVVVVGGGPAGSAAAARVLQTDSHARVLILDREAFPRDKVCGDGIAAEAFRALAELGVDPAELTSGYPARQRLRLRSPGGRSVDRPMREDVFVVPRVVVDARLLSLVVRRGAVLRRHRVRSVEESADRVLVDGTIECSVLIGADGAESTVRRATGQQMNTTGQVAVAIRGYGVELPGQNGSQIINMARNGWPAYAWSFPTRDGLANIGYGELLGCSPANRARMIERLHALMPDAAAQSIVMRGHRLPLSTGRPAMRPGRILLVGDALSLINPLSGEGIYYAVRSGMAAGDAVPAGRGAGALYGNLLGHRLGRHLRHTSALTKLTRRPGLLDAGVQAAHRDQRAFDDLVKLTLADGVITARLVGRLGW